MCIFSWIFLLVVELFKKNFFLRYVIVESVFCEFVNYNKLVVGGALCKWARLVHLNLGKFYLRFIFFKVIINSK